MAEAKTTAKKYSEEDVNKLIQEKVAAAVAEALAKEKLNTQTVLQVSKDEYVTVMYMGKFAQGTTVCIPEWGSINAAGGTLEIPKKEFKHGIGIALNDELLRTRKLIVLDGLTEEERERYKVNYGTGDVLSCKAFEKLLDFSKEEICKTFKLLCKEHKQLVAQIYNDAYFGDPTKGGEHTPDKRVNIDTVRALNAIAKECGETGLFSKILEDYGSRLSDATENT